MAAALTFVDLIAQAANIADGLFSTGDKGETTTVNLAIGQENPNSNMGGSMPHVAIFDVHGDRIGQYKGNANGHVDAGGFPQFFIANDQTDPPGQAAQPEYLLLSMQENDAICIAYANVAAGPASWVWVGDWARTCPGLPWYYSTLKVGAGTYEPKCVWLDHDHTNGLPFTSMSLHMPDFSSAQALGDEYQENPDTVCKSDPRMLFWNPDVGGDAIPPFFEPPLLYKKDGSDLNPKRVINGYKFPKERSAEQNGTSKGESRRFHRHMSGSHPNQSRARSVDNSGHDEKAAHMFPQHTNPWPEHLHISHSAAHSAKELCGSESSFGPDFVSTHDGFFCDMSAKQSYPLCSEQVKERCFDLESTQLRLHPHREHGKPDAAKVYKSTRQWN